MSRDKEYQRLLNSAKWRELRAWKLQQNPLCELCQAEGFIRSAVDIHHIVPVESAKPREEMARMCFDPSNLQALCIPCHIRVHKEMGKGTKVNHKERTTQYLKRWIDKHTSKNGDQ